MDTPKKKPHERQPISPKAAELIARLPAKKAERARFAATLRAAVLAKKKP